MELRIDCIASIQKKKEKGRKAQGRPKLGRNPDVYWRLSRKGLSRQGLTFDGQKTEDREFFFEEDMPEKG